MDNDLNIALKRYSRLKAKSDKAFQELEQLRLKLERSLQAVKGCPGCNCCSKFLKELS